MINLSDDIKTALKAQGRVLSCTVIVYMTTSGTVTKRTTLTSNKQLISLDISVGSTSNGLDFGQTTCKVLTISSTKFVLSSKDMLDVYVTIVTPNGNKDISLGRYYVDNKQISGNTMTITALDKLIQFEKQLAYEDGTRVKMSSLLTTICTQAGYSKYDASGIVNDYYVTLSYKDKKSRYTMRELLGFIAAMQGGNAYIDYNNKLKITCINDVGTDNGFDMANCFEGGQDIGDDTQTITDVIIRGDGDDTRTASTKDLYGTIILYCPLYIDDTSKAAIIDNVKTRYVGKTYRAATVSKQGFGWYEPQDLINIPTEYDGNINIIISGINYSITAAGFTERLVSAALSEQQSNYNAQKKTDDTGITDICNNIVITESQAKYYIGDYTIINTVDTDKLIYADPDSTIICNGYVVHKRGTTADVYGEYQSVTLNGYEMVSVMNSYEGETSKWTFSFYKVGASAQSSGVTYYPNKAGLFLLYDVIHSPTADYPNGYIYASGGAVVNGVYQHTDGRRVVVSIVGSVKVEFASLTEYYAALKVIGDYTGGLSELINSGG